MKRCDSNGHTPTRSFLLSRVLVTRPACALKNASVSHPIPAVQCPKSNKESPLHDGALVSAITTRLDYNTTSGLGSFYGNDRLSSVNKYAKALQVYIQKMAVPNKNTLDSHKIVKRAKKGKNSSSRLVAIFILLFLAYIFFVLQNTIFVADEDGSPIMERKSVPVEEAPVRTVQILQPLKHEQVLFDIVKTKSCLPQIKKKCKTFVPENSGQRVALIAPPGDMTNSFFRLLQVVLRRAQKKHKIEMELIPTTHMAPYGYGKTHGLTRIIRVVPQPFVLGATDSLQGVLTSGQESQNRITVDDLKASLRQQIRYHCRLNHIAAHTAMWTITTDELVNTPIEDLIEQIQAFLDLTREVLEVAGGGTGDQAPPEDLKVAFTTTQSAGASMLAGIQTVSQDELMSMLDDVLMDDLRMSKNLTAWPCESFWTVGEPSSPLRLSPITKRIAKALSPNCSDPSVSCFVQRDKCESRGDGVCSK
jgi:hypothetical protein